MSVPDVSVITPAYDSMPYVTETVGSVMRQSIGLDRIEYIVVDDGSTDGTGEEIDRLATVWPMLRVVHLDAPSGTPARPRNRGLDVARGRYVFFLDADDFLAPEALERMVALADEQGTDVVLGKMASAGGRSVPKSMYTRDQPRTNVFDSRVYWTLNVMKLFRRELIERLGLRFLEDIAFGEDQPFTATAYLNASGVSVIADYECVSWRRREDGRNMTTLVGLDGLMDVLGVMIPLVVGNVEPGRDRDHLLQRHFEFGVLEATRALLREKDSTKREGAFATLKAWVDEHWNEDIGRRLRPVHRVVFDLVGKGSLDALALVHECERSTEPRELVIDGGRVYDPFPYFRDPEFAVPDWCYDVTERVKTHRYLSEASWEGASLVLAGCAHRIGLDTSDVGFALTLRERDLETEYVLPARTVAVPASASDSCAGSAGFSAMIDPATAANGSPLPDGTWDVRLRVDAQGAVRDIRLGSEKSPDIDVRKRTRIVTGKGGRPSAVTSYFTQGYGNLSLTVDEAGRRIPVSSEGARWTPDEPAVLLTGTVGARGVPPGSVSVRLADPDGAEFEVVADLEEGEDDTRWQARVRLKSVAAGRPLPDGDWSLTARLDIGDIHRETVVSAGEGLDTIRWWRGLRPMHAKSWPKKGRRLRLRVVPVRLRRALARRLRRLFGRPA